MSTVKVTVLTSLFNCKAFIEDYLKYALQMEGLEETEFLLLHNQPTEEETAIIKKYLPQFPVATHVIIPEREGLYATWNRGARMATADLITVWNVDDIRSPESLRLQMNALLENPEAGMSYGDFYGTNEYGEHKSHFYTYPEWSADNKEFERSHLVGCFQMWRKSIHEKIGYYDENFRLVSDMDFQIRTALNYPLVKCKGTLGYYLENQPFKLSSQSDLQATERTAVELRYGVYYKMDLAYVNKAKKKYTIRHVINFGEKLPIEKLVPDYKKFLSAHWPLMFASPFYSAKQLARRIARKLFR